MVLMAKLLVVLSLACLVYGEPGRIRDVHKPEIMSEMWNAVRAESWIRELVEQSAASDETGDKTTLSELLLQGHTFPVSPALMSLDTRGIARRDGLTDPVSAALHSLDARNTTRLDGAMSRLETPANVTEACWRDFHIFLYGLIYKAPWALSMVDAAGKLPSGLLLGGLTWPGSFSQCMKVEATDLHGNHLFSGGYCSVTVGNTSSLNAAQQPSGLKLTVGLCVPDRCSAEDVTGLVNAGLYYIPNDKSVGVLNSACKSKSIPLDSPAIGVICMLSVIGAVLVFATLYDIFIYQPRLHRALNPSPISIVTNDLVSDHTSSSATSLTAQDYTPLIKNPESRQVIKANAEKELVSRGFQVLVSLSMYRSACKLLSTGSAASDLRSVHGIRFISMTWVILGHSFFFGINFVRNITVAGDLIKRVSFQAIINATVSVDTFFLLSGLLLTYLCLKEMRKKGGKINWPLFYFHRFWRLTPPYMLILGTYTALFKYWGEGPFWPQQGVEQNCPSNWYLNLLYINNFVNPLKMCMAWSWYLANDMQFFVISPLILIPLYKSWKYGIPLVLSLLVASFLATGLISTLNNFGPFQDADTLEYFKIYYVTPWCRIGPYLVGILYGYALYRADGEVKIHKGLVVVGWLVAAGCCLSVLYGLYGVYNGHAISVHVSALYNAVARSVWALGVGWVVFACCTGNGGFVNKFLSWEPLIPLSRLTYMAYLVHPVVIMAYYYSRETLIYYTDFTIVYFFLGNLVLSYAVAFVVSLTFESPMMGVEKIVFGRFRK